MSLGSSPWETVTEQQATGRHWQGGGVRGCRNFHRQLMQLTKGFTSLMLDVLSEAEPGHKNQGRALPAERPLWPLKHYSAGPFSTLLGSAVRLVVSES